MSVKHKTTSSKNTKASGALISDSPVDQRLRAAGFQIEGYVSTSDTQHGGDLYIEQETCYDLPQAKQYAGECDDNIIYALVKVSERTPSWKDTK